MEAVKERTALAEGGGAVERGREKLVFSREAAATTAKASALRANDRGNCFTSPSTTTSHPAIPALSRETLSRRVLWLMFLTYGVRALFTSVPPKPSGKSRHDDRVYNRLVRFEFIRFVPFVPSECAFWPVQKMGVGKGSIEKLRHAFSDRQSPFFSL